MGSVTGGWVLHMESLRGGVRRRARATPALVFAGGAGDDGAPEEEVSNGDGPRTAVWGGD